MSSLPDKFKNLKMKHPPEGTKMSESIGVVQKQKLLTTLKKYFGYSDFRSPTQLEAIADVMGRTNDVL